MTRSRPLALCLALATSGCALAETARRDSDASSADDGGFQSFGDASAAPMGVDGYTNFGDGEGADPDNARECFDGRDQDGDGLVDCRETSCAATRACCVGSTSLACCASSPATRTFRFEECEPGDPRACAELGARVVSGTPLVGADRGLVAVAGSGLDGALDFPELALRPRGERIVMRARIAAPASSEQLDAVAFGVWSPELPTSAVSPLVAVLASATRGEVSVVVGSRIVASVPLVAGETEHVLEIEPSGSVTVRLGDSELGPFALALPADEVAPVVFGRVQNEAHPGGTTRMRSLTVERRACDLPAALGRTGGVALTTTSALDEAQITDPSALVRAADTLVAFISHEGPSNDQPAVYVGTWTDGTVEGAAPRLTARALASMLGSGGPVTDLASPDLFEADGAVAAFVAYERGERWAIARIEDLLGSPSASALELGPGDHDHPARLPDGRLLVRHRDAGASARFVLYSAGELAEITGGLCEARASCETARTDTFVLEPSGEPLAFDRDEVSAPVAIEHAGVTRIYYAGRRGTRWSIGMLLEGPDAGFFRLANGGAPVLAPSGQGADALGVAGPAPFVAGDALTLLYAGTDGVRWHLLSARMPLRP